MKYFKVSFLVLVTLGFAAACHKSSTTSQAPVAVAVVPAAAPTIQSQLQGHWIETSFNAGNGPETEIKADANDVIFAELPDLKQNIVWTIDDKQIHFETVYLTSQKAVTLDRDYKIDRNVLSHSENTSATINTDGKTLVLTYSDGMVISFRKLSEQDFLKMQPSAQVAKTAAATTSVQAQKK